MVDEVLEKDERIEELESENKDLAESLEEIKKERDEFIKKIETYESVLVSEGLDNEVLK